jgi:hypothetical protein
MMLTTKSYSAYFNWLCEGNTTTVYPTFNGQWLMVNGQSGYFYTLDGRRMDGRPTKKGVYINNGMKVVIK